MKKQAAIDLFLTVRNLAAALNISPQAIYQWPDDLPQDQSDRVTGAALRLGKFKSVDWHVRNASAKQGAVG